jgi:hypothetical protein
VSDPSAKKVLASLEVAIEHVVMGDHLRQARNTRKRRTKAAQRIAAVAAALHQVERSRGLAQDAHPFGRQGRPQAPVPPPAWAVGKARGHVEIDEGAQTWEWTKPATRSNSASPSLRAMRAAKGARAAARWNARDPRSAVRQA